MSSPSSSPPSYVVKARTVVGFVLGGFVVGFV